MTRYIKDDLLAALDKRIERETKDAAKALAAYERDLEKWRAEAPQMFLKKVKNYGTTGDWEDRYGGRRAYDPPSKPNDGTCLNVQRERNRVALIAPDKRGAIQLSDKDNVLRFIDCKPVPA